MKCIIWFFLFSLPWYTLAQQKNITGTVKDTLHNSVLFANVIAYDLKKDTILLSFTQTNEKGIFSLAVPDSLEEIYLRVSLLGYQDTWKKIILITHNDTLLEPIILYSCAVQIQEVFIVDKRTFNESGDTLTINANSFKDSTEKNIEDLLKKIPGFDVDSQGKIYFKGKEIQRITIEGEDLAKQSYQIISRNFSARPIEDLQVISNFSQNPLLANVHGQSKETILNLRLSNTYKNTWSKQIDLYAGYPFLYDVYFNVGMISKNLKTINFIHTNTMSKTRIPDFTPTQQQSLFPDLLNLNYTWISLYQTLVTDIQPFLYQNYEEYGISTTANYKFNPKTTLKFTGYANKQKQSFTEEQNLQNLSIFITGDRKTTQLQKIPFADIELSYFPDKKHFLTYSSTYKYTHNYETESQHMNIFQNHSELKTKNTFYTQQIHYTHHIKQKYTFHHQVKYTYANRNLNYLLYQYPAQKVPLTNYFTDTLLQNLNLPQHNITAQSDFFIHKMRYSIAYNYLFQDMQSAVHIPDNLTLNSIFTNQNANTLQIVCFSVYKEIMWKKFRVQTEFKPCFIQWNYSSNMYQKKPLYTILPNLSIGYKSFVFTYQYQLLPLRIQELYTGYTFTSSKTLKRGLDFLYPTRSHTSTLVHTHNVYSKGIMIQNSISYSILKGIIANYTQIDSIYTLSQPYPEPTQQTQLFFQSVISKVFFKHRWAINLFLLGFYNNNQNFLYGIPLYTQQKLLTAHFKTYLLPGKVFYFGMGSKIQYVHTKSTIANTSLFFVQSTYQIEPYYDIHLRYKKCTFSTRTQYFLNYNNYFSVPFRLPWMHLQITYFPKKNNYNISLECENIFNHKQWLTNSIHTFSNQQSFIPMRGRMYRLNFTYILQ